jgi:hypothetical protein
MVRASPIEELSALNLTAHVTANRRTTCCPKPAVFSDLANRAASATSNATTTFAGYWMTMRPLSSPEAELRKRETLERSSAGDVGRASRRCRMVCRREGCDDFDMVVGLWKAGWAGDTPQQLLIKQVVQHFRLSPGYGFRQYPSRL